jgi:long-subunit acyl-CoA synthetase (AMP-forming)
MFAKKVTAYLNAEKLCPREVETGCDRSTTPLRVLGLFSKNRSEWAIMDAAACYGNITTVPLYDTIGKEYIAHIIQDTQLSTIAISIENINTILNMK